MNTDKEIVTLITGANRGVGFETASELAKQGQHVLLGARDSERGQAAVKRLTDQGLKVDLIQIDVADDASVKQAAATIQQQYGCLDILINNAGIALDAHQRPSTLPVDRIRQEFEVNFFGLVNVTQTMLPLLKQADYAKIINLASNMGSLALMTNPDFKFYKVNSVGYQASKAAVNCFTIDLSKELQDTNITVNSVNPGWTATEFGGRSLKNPVPTGMQSVAEGAARVVKLALDPENSVTGTFSENDGPLPW